MPSFDNELFITQDSKSERQILHGFQRVSKFILEISRTNIIASNFDNIEETGLRKQSIFLSRRVIKYVIGPLQDKDGSYFKEYLKPLVGCCFASTHQWTELLPPLF
jgi:hypothetical protein